MLQFYGNQPPAPLNALRVGGTCPHCGQRSSFTRMQDLIENVARSAKLREIMVVYHCDACLAPVPVSYDVVDWDPARVDRPRMALPVVEGYDYEHVPEPVARVIKEALDCLSVRAYLGFAAMARRAVRAVVEDLAPDGEARVERHLEEILELTGLDGDWQEKARQALRPTPGVAGPDLDARGAKVLLSLLRDLTYQIYTRPGRVRWAAE
ncbi:MAG: hypothetical protein ACNA8N_05355 [Trueperaceae bacterium]